MNLSGRTFNGYRKSFSIKFRFIIIEQALLLLSPLLRRTLLRLVILFSTFAIEPTATD